MTYQKVLCIIDDAWKAFYDELKEHDFSDEQVRNFAKHLNYADVFNSVEKCAMEAVR